MHVKVSEENMVFDIYSEGICYMSVCTNLPVEQVAEVANRLRPSGIGSKWEVSRDKHFHSGQPNPCKCELNADRIHVLLEC